MALSFEVQVEGMAGLSIASSATVPTQAGLTEFLRIAVTEVVDAIINARPAEVAKFSQTTNATSSIAQTGRIISVMREHDSTDILRPCDKIPASLRGAAIDIESLNYRSKYNPAFYILDGNIHTVPQAASGNNDIVVTQVTYDTGVAYSDSSVDYFPQQYEHLIILNVSIKCLDAQMATYTHTDEDTELAQAIAGSIASLKSQYNMVLPKARAAQAPQQPQRQRAR